MAPKTKKAPPSSGRAGDAKSQRRERVRVVTGPPTEDDRRRAEELVTKYGWDHLRDEG
ncbi:MAG TPA: hypothetical protein VK648_12205 [Gemmatimonadaceae bacterium]|nr:hypothetical protein [Gemmatimonadaceae bacterium]